MTVALNQTTLFPSKLSHTTLYSRANIGLSCHHRKTGKPPIRKQIRKRKGAETHEDKSRHLTAAIKLRLITSSCCAYRDCTELNQ